MVEGIIIMGEFEEEDIIFDDESEECDHDECDEEGTCLECGQMNCR